MQRRRPGSSGSSALAVLACAATVTAPACKSREREREAWHGATAELGSGSGGSSGGSSAGSTGTGGSAGAAAAAPPANPHGGELASAEPEGPTGEVFHAIDRKTTQGFGRGDLAAGGGWIYWIERPRDEPDGGGKTVVRRKPAARPAADPETVAGPGKIFAIAADAARLYVAGESLIARPHAGGAPLAVAAGAWLEIVPGDKHLLIRSRDQVALVPKAGGTAETVWEGKHGKLPVDADGDRFVAIPASPWSQRSAARAITVYAPGARPTVVAELAEARGDLAVDGDWIYFSGEAGPGKPAAPLWRIPRAGTASGAPARVGDPAWGFGDFIVRRGVLYGMVLTGTWKLQKLALAPGAQPVVLDSRVPPAIQALATDASHLYYLTDFEVKRTPR
jgi:hypothetical protein